MELLFLGYNSALPTANKHSTSQLLKVQEQYFVIDCGEGMQSQLRKAKTKFSKIDHIFISHLHGDHVFGLVGLLSSFNLLGREKPLYIFGPKGIQELIQTQLKITQSFGMYELIFNELESLESKLIYENKNVEVHTIPLRHRIYCNGYLFKEKPKPRNLRIEEVQKYPEIERCDYHNLKLGKDFTLSNGDVIKNEFLTKEGIPPMSYAFCSDTMFLEKYPEILKGTDVLYHESTFLHKDLELARKTGHSTAEQAAYFANEINAKALFLGHFSNRYTDYEAFLEEASNLFENTFLPKELKKYNLREICAIHV